MSVGSHISEYAPQGVSQTTPFAIPDWLARLVVARHPARTGGGGKHSDCDRTRQTDYSPGRAHPWPRGGRFRRDGSTGSTQDPNRTSSFLIIRVSDIQAVYEEWSARDAELLTPPKQHQAEFRCYIRDPDGHLIEVSQTALPGGWNQFLNQS
jgi:catechol 2,3-dioxygenase-like lactoylglutathione lyase family enzyme